LVIHLKLYFYSIDNIKPTEKKFSEILSEKSSLKTLELENSNEFLNLNTKTYFWDDNKNYLDDKPYIKNDIFEIYPSQVLNNMLNLIEHFYKIIYNKNNMITYIDNGEGNIESIIAECCSFGLSLEITDILNVKNNNTLCFNLIFNKIVNILEEQFKPLYQNFYCNEKLDNESLKSDIGHEETETVKDKDSYLIEMKHIIHNKNMKAKDLFIIELTIVELFSNGSEVNHKVLLYEKDKFNETLLEINKKLTTPGGEGLSSVNFKLTVFFLPEIEDIFTELTKEEIPIDNSKLYSIENGESVQFYNNDNYLSKIIPSYIKYHNQDYFISINIKQKTYLHRLIDSLTSLQNIIVLENLRYAINVGGNSQKPDYLLIYDYFNKINTAYLTTCKLTFKVSNKPEIINYMGDEGEVVLASALNSDRYIFIVAFENFKDNLYKDFVKFCLSNTDNNIFKPEDYMVPIWLIFTVSNNKEADNRKRKYSVEEFRDTELTLEIKFYEESFFNGLKSKDIIIDKIKEMMTYYIETLDKKVIANSGY
jgi:hypothetical protein